MKLGVVVVVVCVQGGTGPPLQKESQELVRIIPTHHLCCMPVLPLAWESTAGKFSSAFCPRLPLNVPAGKGEEILLPLSSFPRCVFPGFLFDGQFKKPGPDFS